MKNIIKKALLAVLLVPVIALGVSAVTPGGAAFAADCTNGGTTCTGIQSGINATGDDASSGANLSSVFKTVVNVLLFVIGAIAVIMLIVGGLRYVMSAGNSTAVQAAKNTILYAIIGLVIAFLAYAIINWVLGALQGQASTS